MRRFKDLPIGARFEFASVLDPMCSGFERGPWIKVSARKYAKLPGDSRPMECTVGSINVGVILAS